MRTLNRIGISFLAVLMLASSAYGMKSDYTTISNYHKQEIAQLLKDYTLEESLTIRVELKRKDEQEAPEKYVNIPGLYQKTGDSPDSKIENVLNLYERKIVLIQKREIGEKEMELVKSSLSERLFLPADAQFTMLNDIPKVGDAVKNMKSDFVFGAYNTLIKNGQFLWILIFSIGFIVALWVLAKVWKSKSEAGAGGEISMAGGGESASPEAVEKDDSSAGGMGSISMSNSEFETFNFGSLCQNINDAYKRSPGSTAHIMWSHIPDLQSQIQFYEIIRIQNQIDTTVIAETYKILDEIFAFEKRASSNKHKRGKGFDKTTLSIISVELARLKFVQPHEQIEKAFGALYPFKSDHMEAIFKDGINEHYIVLYKLFKDDFMNYISSSNDSTVLDKINDLLMFDPESDHASDEQYTAFGDFLTNQSFDEVKDEKKSVNSKIVHMIYGLSEVELDRVEAMKSNEDLKAEIPCMTWINLADANKLKSFMITLTGPETKCFIEHDKSHEEALETMDDRTKFRVQEKMTQAKGASVNWRQFRNKIKKHYSYQSNAIGEGADEAKNDVAKAS